MRAAKANRVRRRTTLRCMMTASILAFALSFPACDVGEITGDLGDWTLFGDDTWTMGGGNTAPTPRYQPSISGDRVVWTDHRNIYLYDLDESLLRRVFLLSLAVLVF